MNYEELLEKARETYESEDTPHIVKAWLLANIIGPADESEDERIRVGIIALLKFGLEDGSAIAPGFNETKEQALAWLEKQGKSNSQTVLTIPKFTFNDVLALQCCMETVKKVQEDKKLYEKLKDLHSKVYDSYQLEKQGDKKNTCKRKIDDAYLQGICDAKNVIEKQGEPTDKVEPKFHEGDWITDGYIHCNITEILDDRYIFESKYDKRGAILFEHENRYHLWTIEDAKKGDVLDCEGYEYLLFKSFSNIDGRIKLYCWYNVQTNNFHDRGTDSKLRQEANIHPATKEQRDLLFRKMKEAGYEWNNEKKELKKIEPKTLNADEVIGWLTHRHLNDSDIQSHVIPDNSPTSNLHRTKWLSDRFVEQFKQDFEI